MHDVQNQIMSYATKYLEQLQLIKDNQSWNNLGICSLFNESDYFNFEITSSLW